MDLIIELFSNAVECFDILGEFFTIDVQVSVGGDPGASEEQNQHKIGEKPGRCGNDQAVRLHTR